MKEIERKLTYKLKKVILEKIKEKLDYKGLVIGLFAYGKVKLELGNI